ncbi:MAG: ABC transporter substrate-binding protein [Acidimicrobiia bacterium]|nr:MAG: ABC transporter substrate-binding protein [Acidimicrobiia bacterium]
MRIRNVAPIAVAMLLLATACAQVASGTATTNPVATTAATRATTTTAAASTTTKVESLFPVTVETDSGPVTIEAMPQRIVSLSPTATETLFAVGAGDQVIAVDEYSYYPEEAPVTDLSGFSPNVEAIISYAPDLLVISGSPDDLQAAIEAVGVPVLLYGSAATLDDAYAQIEKLGTATGHPDESASIVADMKTRVAAVAAAASATENPFTYYHELDPTYYSVTSSTFIGQIYGLLGLESIADAADPDGYGFPQLSEEYIIGTNPDFVFLADARCCGESSDSVGARPGWDNMDAVLGGRVIEVDADIASRWGPRIVDFIEAVAEAVLTDANA